jgi:hypothetical protein
MFSSVEPLERFSMTTANASIYLSARSTSEPGFILHHFRSFLVCNITQRKYNHSIVVRDALPTQQESGGCWRHVTEHEHGFCMHVYILGEICLQTIVVDPSKADSRVVKQVLGSTRERVLLSRSCASEQLS